MNIPRVSCCRECGREVLWATAPNGRRMMLDAILTGYRKVRGRGDLLFTKEGYQILNARRVSRDEEERTGVDGYAHRPHYITCTAKKAVGRYDR